MSEIISMTWLGRFAISRIWKNSFWSFYCSLYPDVHLRDWSPMTKMHGLNGHFFTIFIIVEPILMEKAPRSQFVLRLPIFRPAKTWGASGNESRSNCYSFAIGQLYERNAIPSDPNLRRIWRRSNYSSRYLFRHGLAPELRGASKNGYFEMCSV